MSEYDEIERKKRVLRGAEEPKDDMERITASVIRNGGEPSAFYLDEDEWMQWRIAKRGAGEI